MIINLLSNPRNISTALMYSFAQRSDCTVLDEPFYGHYLDKTGIDHPGRNDVMSAQPLGYNNILSQIKEQAASSEHLFIKNMAHHLRDIEIGFFEKCFNLIFIRHPRKVLASFAKVVDHPTLEDIAIKDQYGLARSFEENNIPYCIMDSASIIDSPRLTLEALCEQIGIPFEPSMLNWRMGPKSYDGVWAPFWYGRVHESSSFEPAGKQIPNPLPENLIPVLEEAMIYYSQLSRLALSVS
jgi:hypothetical protein